jgi:hypothetical protein
MGSPIRSRRARGRESVIGYPSSGGVSGPPQSRNLRPWLKPLRGRAESPNSARPRGRIRFNIRRRWSAARVAQFVARLPENAVASAFAASAVTLLPQHRAPTPNEWPLQRWDVALLRVSPRPRALVCDPDQVALPMWIDVPSRPVPSGHDRAANPIVSDIHPGSIRVGCLCGGVRFFPGTRIPGKPRNRDAQIAALKRRG